MATTGEPGLEALHKLKSIEPPVFLAPSSISQVARNASQYLFSSLKPYSPKSPFDQLLVDGFDAEQIWQQIDMQSQPLLSGLRREVKRFEKNPEEISKLKNLVEVKSRKVSHEEEEEEEEEEEDDDDMDMDLDGFDTDDDDDDEDEELEGKNHGGEKERQESGSESEGEDEGEEEGEKDGDNGGIEDKFFRIKDLEEYLEEREAEEFGVDNKKKKAMVKAKREPFFDDDEEDGDEEDDEDGEGGNSDHEDEPEEEEEDDDLGALGYDDDGEYEEMYKLENARYEDFFGVKKKRAKRKSKDAGAENGAEQGGNQGRETLSTHEKELLKLQSKIEQMEKANLEPKHWTMQGEVTAAKRPKNSALEVDLDFEHNVRPPPVITEEVTASLEEMIKNRIIEGRFDDVQKAPRLATKSPREVKELDDNKSKKGLAEVYEEEYVQKTNSAFAATSFSDELKKEASMLFKKLCLRLDALSHFHFTPKPVIEDMSIQTNVPAIVMEEVAPVAVSDAAMLAPEEIFSGKGNVKEEAELTKAERKRRRANKKRKFKAESAKRLVNKAQDNAAPISKAGDEN